MNTRRTLLISLLSIFCFSSAHAQLGKVSAKVQSVSDQCFTVSSSTAKNGTTINEYAANGTVFAVTWEGLRAPDLKKILGDYHSEVVTELNSANATKKSKHLAHVQSGNVELHQSIHQRRSVGSAVLKDQVPACVKPGDIK
ncbi:MAG: DUF2844 domain-containing protein [Pseudobdellovibrio sp.]